jgi:broad specificity phosphatase PhoE
VSRSSFKEDVEVERDSYGHFYYRFDGGESCADVYDRVSDFMGTMHRDFQKKDFPRNVIIVTHGMTMRLFLMRWFHASVEEFEQWGNPKNCEYYLLKLMDNEKYELVTPLSKHIIKHSFQFPWGDDKKHFPFPHKLTYKNNVEINIKK